MRFSGKILVLLVLGWVSLTAALEWRHYQRQAAAIIHEKTREGKGAADELARRLVTTVNSYRGLTLMLAQAPLVLEVLNPKDRPVSYAPSLPSDISTNPPGSSDLDDLNTYLQKVHQTLGPSIAWVMATNGLCVAASNRGPTNSFVGNNFEHREFFRQARQSGESLRYALGSLSHKPGLYFASRVLQHGQFAGVVAIKLNMDRLSDSLDESNAFLVDGNGVVIMANNPALVLEALPSATVERLTPKGQMDHYQTNHFPTLAIAPWRNTNSAPLISFNHEPPPQLLFSQIIPHEGLRVYVPEPLPALLTLSRDCQAYFMLIAMAGSSLILLLGASLNYSHCQQQAHSRLKNQAELLMDAERIARLGSWDCELPAGRLQLSEQASEILQVPPGQDAGTHARFADLAMPVDRDRVSRAIHRTLQHGDPCDLEYELTRPDDGRTIIHLQGRLEKTPQGQCRRLVGTVQDITARKRVERELFQSRETLMMVLNHIPQRVFWKNRDLIFEGCNLPMARDCGLADPAKVIGKSDFELLDAETAEIYRTLDREVMESNQPKLNFEMTEIRPDGRPAYLLVSKLPLHDQNGRVVGVLGTFEDITGRKLLEEQLRQSQKMEAIGRLAGGIAHDFNNLLTVICGYSEVLLLELPSTDPSRDALKEIRKAGDRAAALTRKLLAFSRKQILEPDVLDLNALIGDCENMFRRLLGEEITLSMKMAPDLGKIKADASQIDQVLLNLVVNARDAMPRGGQLVIETANRVLTAADCLQNEDLTPGKYVTFSVSDTGCGMDKPTILHIFEPFYTTKDIGKGTGLGLAMIFGFIKQSGGQISVASELGQGSEFRIFLPEFHPPQQ